MDRATAKKMRVFLEGIFKDAEEKAEKELGVKFSVGGSISFSGDNASVKVTASDIREGGVVMTKEASDFKLYAFRYGLKEEDLFATFEYGNKKYKIMGAKPRSKKAPILAEHKGKSYKVPAEVVKMALGR